MIFCSFGLLRGMQKEWRGNGSLQGKGTWGRVRREYSCASVCICIEVVFIGQSFLQVADVTSLFLHVHCPLPPHAFMIIRQAGHFHIFSLSLSLFLSLHALCMSSGPRAKSHAAFLLTHACLSVFPSLPSSACMTAHPHLPSDLPRLRLFPLSCCHDTNACVCVCVCVCVCMFTRSGTSQGRKVGGWTW